ncbi:flippase [Arcticibacter sp. MXS-1]|uniref:flippase n=1 Tax=Arcticibacter sp. MXS-1 TaxID=3341726 RepID=UPI0035A90C37
MSLRKNVIYNFILTSSNVLFPLITFPYVARILSNDSYGRIAFIDAFTGYFLVLVSLGIPTYGVREISRVKDQPERYSKLAVELVSIQFVLSLIFSAIFLALTLWVPSLQQNVPLVRIACFIIVFTSFSMDWFYQGIENFGYVTKRSLFTKVLNVASILILVKANEDYYIYYLISVLTVVVNSSWNFIYFLRKYYHSFKEKLVLLGHLKPLLIFFTINVSVSVYAVLDTIILGLYTSPATVSLYSVPLKLVKMFWVLVNAAGVVFIPRVAALFAQKDEDAISSLIQKSNNIVFLLTIPFSVLCFFFPAEILFVVSGDKYLRSADALRILALAPLIIGYCSVLGSQYLLPTGQEKKVLTATVGGLIVSLAVNFSLIPYLGHIGAAVACILAESTVCLMVYRAAAKKAKIRLDRSLLALIGVSLIVSVTAGLVLRAYVHHFLLLLIIGAVYVITFLALQLLHFRNEFVFTLMGDALPWKFQKKV